jgi:hypothetical protein
MSISLDGFIAGPNERPDNGLGEGGERLHDWAAGVHGPDDLEATRRLGGVNGKVIDEFMTTGASSRGGGPSSRPAAGAATTTTACRSSSSPATTPPIWTSGRWSPT